MSRRILRLCPLVLLLAASSAMADDTPKTPDPTTEPAIPATAAPEIAPKPETPPATPTTSAPAKPEGFLTAEEAAANKLGFYFVMSLEKMSQLGQANGIGFVVDPQAAPGSPFAVTGPEVDGDFRSRWALGFKLGFRLRGNHGRVEAGYFQWQEQQDLNARPPDGKALASALTSPLAGYYEDVGRPLIAGGPDGAINGFEAGSIPEGSEAPDRELDGAEDVNFNLFPDFIRMGTINRIAGEMKTNLKVLDLDYVRTLKQLKRLRLDGRAGLRFASVTQLTDIGYQEVGAFAVYSDDEGATGSEAPAPGNVVGCSPVQMGHLAATVQDGDGDGETNSANNEHDGDGFMNGDCDTDVKDSLDSVQTVSEDRIVAAISTVGQGLTLGMDGRFELASKWRLIGGIGVSAMSSKSEFRYRETFTSERDRYLNFIDWDFNGDGKYDNLDFDFDGSCRGILENCAPTTLDGPAMGLVGNAFAHTIRHRTGLQDSIARVGIPGASNALGVNTGAYQGMNANLIRQGDPVGEAERNRDTVTETTLLTDVAGSKTSWQPMLDLHVGVEFQFSKFAHVGIGLRSSRWYGAGAFRSLANDVVNGRDPQVGGDFSQTGAYFMVTVVPR